MEESDNERSEGRRLRPGGKEGEERKREGREIAVTEEEAAEQVM